MEIIQKIRLGNSVPAIAAGALFYGDEQLCGEEHIPVPPTPDYSTMCLTLESLEYGNTITFTKVGSAPENTFYYSTNDGATWTSANSTTTWSGMNTGSKVMLKATADRWGTSQMSYWNLTSTKTFNAYGNIMSLLYGDNFIGQTALPSYEWTFVRLFYQSKIVDASNLIFPATSLYKYCYHSVFRECASLTTAPELLSTTLAQYCYICMFQDCTSLVNVQSTLPATTLATQCYWSMFQGCTSLTTAPEIPATSLTDYCFYNMFNGCTSLNYIKCLAYSNMSAYNALSNWVANVASSGTFVKKNGASWPTGASGIPSGWTIQTA